MNPYWTLFKPFAPYVLGILLILGAYGLAHHAGAVSQKTADAKEIAGLNADRQRAIDQLNADVVVFKRLTGAAKANQAAFEDAKARVTQGDTTAAAQHVANDDSYAAWVKRYQQKLRDNPVLAKQFTSKACETPDLDY